MLGLSCDQEDVFHYYPLENNKYLNTDLAQGGLCIIPELCFAQCLASTCWEKDISGCEDCFISLMLRMEEFHWFRLYCQQIYENASRGNFAADSSLSAIDSVHFELIEEGLS